VFELKDFTQVQASVFQVARAPGKNIVYLGCALLILGVFAMLYIRERRVWVWLARRGGQLTPPWRCPPTARPWTATASSSSSPKTDRGRTHTGNA
jgi:cytochrome c biogenesis protein ResB